MSWRLDRLRLLDARDGCQRIISNRVELQSPYRSSLHLPRED
jgi:hypothetical protein